MTSKNLYDREGKLIGTLNIYSDRQTLFSRDGGLLGTWSASSDKTHDRSGRLVGSGNLLMTLL
jgi:hypothetical protein